MFFDQKGNPLAGWRGQTMSLYVLYRDRLSVFAHVSNEYGTTRNTMSYFYKRKVLLWLAISSFIYIFGCAPLQVKDGVFFPPHEKYTVSIPGKGWEPMRVDGEDIALWHEQHGAMIAIMSSKIENEGFSLETLRRHLFLGMTGKKIISKESVSVNSQSALHTIAEGEVDNNKLKIDSYIIKAGDTVYDMVYWAPAVSFDSVKADFENMVQAFYLKN